IDEDDFVCIKAKPADILNNDLRRIFAEIQSAKRPTRLGQQARQICGRRPESSDEPIELSDAGRTDSALDGIPFAVKAENVCCAADERVILIFQGLRAAYPPHPIGATLF